MTDFAAERSTQLNESTLRYAHDQGFLDKSLVIRCFIGIFFTIILFFNLHFRQTLIESFQVNEIADKYVVAEVPFNFVDDEATFILRQEALRDIGRIYRIDENQVIERREEFKNTVIQNPHLQEELSELELEDLYMALDTMQIALSQMLLTDPSTVQKLQEVGLYTSNFQIFTPSDTSSNVILPAQIWTHLQKVYFNRDTFRPSITALVMDFFKAKPWNLEEDLRMRKRIKSKVQAEVPEKYTRVTAGSRIIDRGDRITPRQITMLDAMKEEIQARRNLWQPVTLIGTLIITLVITAVSGIFLNVNYPSVFHSNRRLCLLVGVIVLTLLFSRGVENIILTSRGALIDWVHYPLIVPFAAILICNLMSAGLAMATSAFLTIILAICLAFNIEGFLLVNIVGAVVAVLTTRSLRRRKELFAICVKVWLASVLVILGIHLYHFTFTDGTINLMSDAISSAIFMGLTGILILGILPFLESLFSVMSDVTLIEYMDPDSELLRRLSFEAPGTYQHTLVVCNLAEMAATAIGANGLFCRVASLYHDIGKMVTPQYFTENQLQGVDMHQLLTPKESAQAIMAHVSEGVTIARKAALPQQIIDVIRQHHGTTLVYFFYHKQLEIVGGDASQINEQDFRYPGPKPRSKESAIIMIADSFEAASRSLDVIEEKALKELIDRLVDDKAKDGQFDECLLTFEEMHMIKNALVKGLLAAYHSRVKYPNKEMKNV
ncbi:MAG: HD family phosphohydrolase [Chlamydiales bacterium]